MPDETGSIRGRKVRKPTVGALPKEQPLYERIEPFEAHESDLWWRETEAVYEASR